MKKKYQNQSDEVHENREKEAETVVVTEEFKKVEEAKKEVSRLNDEANKLEAEAKALSDKVNNLRLQAKKEFDRAEELAALLQKEKKVASQRCDEDETVSSKGLKGKKVADTDVNGAMKVYAVQDEDGKEQIFSSPGVASYYDHDFKIIPVWVVAGCIDHIMPASEAAKYF